MDGRISSSYKNAACETIYLFDIERTVLDIEQDKQCKAVISEIKGKKTHVAHIVLTDGTDEETTLRAIKVHCENKLLANHIPTLVKLYVTARLSLHPANLMLPRWKTIWMA